MTAYYNEIDPYCAQWLRNLIAAGHIAPGVVDERSIEDVRPDELVRFTQCHFFAGLGAWSLALRGAGWADDRPVWTGSCPCQPFSTAGKGDGFADERHLWPTWFHLIGERRPPVVFGEQVASKDADPWIDLVQDDLEALGYPFGAVPFPAAGVGCPGIRDRLYWVADTTAGRRREERANPGGNPGGNSPEGLASGPVSSGATGRLADASGCRCGEGGLHACRCSQAQGQRPEPFAGNGGPHGLGFWSNAEWIACLDGKLRPVEPGTFPLAHGTTARVGRLRAYGNAINAQAAQIFIESVIAAQPHPHQGGTDV